MQAGLYRLKRLGITKLTQPTGLLSAMNQLPDEAIALAAASHIERELQITPWNLSSNFVACTNQVPHSYTNVYNCITLCTLIFEYKYFKMILLCSFYTGNLPMLYKSNFYDMDFNCFGIEFENYLNKLMDFLMFFFFFFNLLCRTEKI